MEWGGGCCSMGGGFSSGGTFVVYGQKLNRNSVKKMQDRSDAGHEGCRTGEIRTGSVRTGGVTERRDAGQEKCRK